MKKLILAILIALPFAAMSQTYTAGYSSKFAMANSSYSDKILSVWKDFETNMLDQHLDMFSDTVTMILANGQTVKGRAQNLAGAKEYRGSIKNYKVKVEAWMSVKSLDKGENIVLVWGNEDFTDKDGKSVHQRLHEVWVFNKDGKISLMMQYAGGGGM